MRKTKVSASRLRDLDREQALEQYQDALPFGSSGKITDDDLLSVAHKVKTGLPWIPPGWRL